MAAWPTWWPSTRRWPPSTERLSGQQGRPSLKARKSAGYSAEALKLATAVKGRLPERSLLETLTRTTRHLRWFRHFGPLSGSEAKLADALERYLQVAFAYIYDLDAPPEGMEVHLDLEEQSA